MKCFDIVLPKALASELETKFFWWEVVGSQPRTNARILAQAMELAPFEDVRRLETVELMLNAEPGWLSDRSWEFWRGRLTIATGKTIPEEAPRRSLDADAL
jgi:hypothetical protein